MCSAGCPINEEPSQAARRMVLLGEDMIRAVQKFQPEYLPGGFRIDIRGIIG